jgi:hypothetical protein
VSITGQSIVSEAKKFLGDPYVYGAAGPSSFDCSGLVQYVLTQLGVKGVPRTSEAQWGWVQKISRSQLQPGDLIFEQWPGDNSPPGHVVIYAGGGQVIEAPHTGADVHLRAWSPSETTIVGYGRPQGLAAAKGSGGGSGGVLGSILSLPSDVTGMFSQAEKLAQGLMWFFNPENWARLLAGVFGLVLLCFGLGFLVWAGA